MRPCRTLPRCHARRVLMALPLALSLATPALAQVGAPTGVSRRPQPAVPSDPAPAAPQPPDLTQP
ncbi:hypothetical protein, partial [Pseudoroseomonas ludipueritiae]|nr:hypothetical protein [Pseudoroseomonas ludipueritiae]